MPKRIVADPESGFPGKIEEKGTWVEGFYKMVAYAYGPGEIPPADIDRATIAELRAKYWDPTRRAVVIPWRGGRTFEFGPKLLSQTTDTTVVHVRPEFLIPGEFPKPRCGRRSMTSIDDVRPNGSILRTFRRWIRPAILGLLRSLPSPEKCGCQARKEWLTRHIQAI